MTQTTAGETRQFSFCDILIQHSGAGVAALQLFERRKEQSICGCLPIALYVSVPTTVHTELYTRCSRLCTRNGANRNSRWANLHHFLQKGKDSLVRSISPFLFLPSCSLLDPPEAKTKENLQQHRITATQRSSAGIRPGPGGAGGAVATCSSPLRTRGTSRAPACAAGPGRRRRRGGTQGGPTLGGGPRADVRRREPRSSSHLHHLHHHRRHRHVPSPPTVLSHRRRRSRRCTAIRRMRMRRLRCCGLRLGGRCHRGNASEKCVLRFCRRAGREETRAEGPRRCDEASRGERACCWRRTRRRRGGGAARWRRVPTARLRPLRAFFSCACGGKVRDSMGGFFETSGSY
jgi:hypothetical protein